MTRGRQLILVILFSFLVALLWARALQAADPPARSTGGHAKPVRIPKPILAPAALLKARLACPNTATPVECRSALRAAYAAVDWQRQARWHAKAMTVRMITLDAITWAAAKYGVSASDMRAVGTCESHLWPFATNGQYQGWAQLSARHRSDPIFSTVPWQDAYAVADHVARYVKAHGWSEWQCQPSGGLRW